ncbi:unnamed protein product [Gadus morhua 'NCC']
MLDAGPHWTPAVQDRCLMLGLTGLQQHKTVSTLRSDLLGSTGLSWGQQVGGNIIKIPWRRLSRLLPGLPENGIQVLTGFLFA